MVSVREVAPYIVRIRVRVKIALISIDIVENKQLVVLSY
jgi:hypothetical protein